jgi:sterol O-acyltransferase
MIMKCHSYMATNGYLQWVDDTYRKTKRQLEKEVKKSHIGGWGKAFRDAAPEEEAEELHQSDSDTSTPPIEVDSSGRIKSFISETGANTLKNKLLGAGGNNATIEVNVGTVGPKQHPLVNHPNTIISSLAQNLSDMEIELTSRRTGNVRWPDNISWWNFMDYQLIPTLVYELEYPRTNR